MIIKSVYNIIYFLYGSAVSRIKYHLDTLFKTYKFGCIFYKYITWDPVGSDTKHIIFLLYRIISVGL